MLERTPFNFKEFRESRALKPNTTVGMTPELATELFSSEVSDLLGDAPDQTPDDGSQPNFLSFTQSKENDRLEGLKDLIDDEIDTCITILDDLQNRITKTKKAMGWWKWLSGGRTQLNAFQKKHDDALTEILDAQTTLKRKIGSLSGDKMIEYFEGLKSKFDNYVTVFQEEFG